ncbi:OLC1v1013082C1 [Oldenlandia corymbosa var. corymbosa]|uniref:OLC1v1013082C1 n=1 Tax=Oldenlandia corymbosa var. corymbosa TaxID=529605 RepID=A0AAV1DXD8_OLDCO|nr:OLC1v1013082C1 [Oldenlandia corymbosa var. corymbosa]
MYMISSAPESSIESFDPEDPKFEKGTTVMAFAFNEGIMVAVDHSSKTSNSARNVVQLNSRMLATITGGREYLLEHVKQREHGLYQMNGRGEVVSEDIVATGSGSGAISILIAEYAKRKGFGGVATGRASLRSDKRKRGMSVTEAADLAKKTLCYAADSAPVYGDVVTVYYLGNEGCKKLLEDDIEA